jgi:hypothetical protein
MKHRIFIAFCPLLILMSAAAFALADLRPEKVHVTEAKKTQNYIKDGLFVGGDRAINGVVVKDIRRAANPAYERVVIDLEGTKNGEPAAIQRPPYYQMAVTPDEKRLVLTLWGSPKLGFDAKKVLGSFKKSAIFDGVVLLPRLESDNWTLVFPLKTGHPVEVFELSNPIRVIVDVRRDSRQ